MEIEKSELEVKGDGVLAGVRLSLLSKLEELRIYYDQMITHKKGEEFKQEYFKGFNAGANFIIEELFGAK